MARTQKNIKKRGNHKRRVIQYGKHKRTQKAGSRQRKQFVEDIIKNTGAINLLIKSLNIRLTRVQSKADKKPVDKGTNANAKGIRTVKESGDNSIKETTPYDKESLKLYNAVKRYVIGLLNKFYRKLPSKMKSEYMDETKIGSIRELIKSYINDILLYGVGGDNSRSSATILLSPSNNCSNYYDNERTYMNIKSDNELAYLAKDRKRDMNALQNPNSLDGVRSALGSLLGIETRIYNKVPASRTSSELSSNKSSNTYIEQMARCNFFIPYITIDNPSKYKDLAQNKIITIPPSKDTIIDDPVSRGSVYHLIKKSEHTNYSKNLIDKFYIIRSRMREIRTYAHYMGSIIDNSDKSQDTKSHKKTSKANIYNTLTDKETIKNNALGLMYYISRHRSLNPPSAS